jgi:hypothetical protein
VLDAVEVALEARAERVRNLGDQPVSRPLGPGCARCKGVVLALLASTPIEQAVHEVDRKRRMGRRRDDDRASACIWQR